MNINKIKLKINQENKHSNLIQQLVEPIGKTSVRYPKNVSTGDKSDFVIFDFFDYQPPFQEITQHFPLNYQKHDKKVKNW